MKLIFENDKEKDTLKYILNEYFNHNGDSDVLGCEPACRNEESPGCDWCINNALESMLDEGELSFWTFGGEDWILQNTKITNKEIDGNERS